MVEVCENDIDSFVLNAEEILYRHLDIVESDVGGSRCSRVGGFDRGSFDAFASFDDNDGKALVYGYLRVSNLSSRNTG